MNGQVTGKIIMFNPYNKALLFQSSFWYILPLVGWGNLFRTVYTKDFIM